MGKKIKNGIELKSIFTGSYNIVFITEIVCKNINSSPTKKDKSNFGGNYQ